MVTVTDLSGPCFFLRESAEELQQIGSGKSTLLTFSALAHSEGYGSCSMCVYVCMCVYS